MKGSVAYLFDTNCDFMLAGNEPKESIHDVFLCD